MFQKLFNKLFKKCAPQLEAPSLSALLSKEGKLPMDDILGGKYKNILLEQKVDGCYYVSKMSPKTGSKTTFVVTPAGKLLKKETILGAGNSGSELMHSNNIIYSGGMKDGHVCVVPTRLQIKYKVPYRKGEEKGFSDTLTRTLHGWVRRQPLPFNNF